MAPQAFGVATSARTPIDPDPIGLAVEGHEQKPDLRILSDVAECPIREVAIVVGKLRLLGPVSLTNPGSPPLKLQSG
jgi:hypothetical protein